MSGTAAILPMRGVEHSQANPSHEPAKSMVQLRDVAVDYGSLRVLQPTDLDVGEGEFLTILGPSGSGKTTILKLIGGFLRPTAGRIMFAGRDITAVPPERRPFNTVFQDYALFPHMTVAENVAYSLRVMGVAKRERYESARSALDLVGLADFGGRRVNQLSGGQQQRVALARAIVAKPSVILLDEPLSALDAALRYQMQSFLKSTQRKLKTTFVFVTHDQQEALAMSDRIAVMSAGNISQIGMPDEIYNQPRNAFVAGFIGRNNLFDATPAVGAGQARFQTAAGPIAAADVGGPTEPGKTRLAVRPENIVLRKRGSGNPDGRNKLEGVVTEISFAGTHYIYQVEIGSNAQVLECSGRAELEAHPFSIGDQVDVLFSPRDVRVVTP